MPKRVLIVCVGNICRSPTAEAILRHRLREQPDNVVESAGLAALRGMPIDPQAEQVLAAHGLSAGTHVARQISPALIEGADLVLAMERRHLEALRVLAPKAVGKIFMLGKWQRNIDIPDPYGRGAAAFKKVYPMIDAAVEAWLPRIYTHA
ncbi:protein-tyrosine phosphatase [Luteimonas cucumeris]|uniref:protein-tyrosine-phosphatase n=1 Tax=Luteimonas cucumeris TaxID=985012 RepID=A0A562L2A3_9GAMM|nr:low molecular weight protein-tyrosine-phosphatase [Luteimonas cucumeris]TWI01761.1 protein-tyrosine phosphatase [Luteimonas cucumeris]